MSLKLSIPPASASSAVFVAALKACVAAELLKSGVQIAECASGSKRVTLEEVKEHQTLFEANAIVTYLFKRAGETDVSLPEAAAIEWEESCLRPALQQSGGDATNVLSALESLLGRLQRPPNRSAVSVILFSTLYQSLAGLDPAALEKYPTVAEWYRGMLSDNAVKTAVEAVARYTSVESVSTGSQPDVTNILPGGGVKEHDGRHVLPREGERNILITSALPYVNNVPHLGNIIGSVLSADVFSRYCRARNYNTLFICGTDEYGTATETRALADGVTPQELCTKYHAIHAAVYNWFDIDFDTFGRTSTAKQTKIASDIFLGLKDHGYLAENSMTQLYCEEHKAFLADRFVEGTCPRCAYEDARGDQCDQCGALLDPFELIDPHCKVDGSSPVVRDTKHIFLELDKLQGKISEWAERSSSIGHWSANGKAITDKWLKEGLRPRSITRDLKWGTPVPLPGWDDKVLYVWFDACIGYLSITANLTDEWEQWWRRPELVKLYQFMGKDNVPFHTVVFPGSLLGTDETWTMLHHISTTEYLNYEGGKFSKSRNRGVFGDSAKLTGVSASVWRYYLIASRPETSDTMFNWNEFAARNNSELLNSLGNFVNRVVKFTIAKLGGAVPAFSESVADSGDAFKVTFRHDVDELLAQYISAMEGVHLRDGLRIAMAMSARGNQFLQENKFDNTLLKDNPAKCGTLVAFALNYIYLLSSVFSPFIPGTSEQILQQLRAPALAIPDRFTLPLQPGHSIGPAQYLFSRITDDQVAEWRSKFGGGD